MVQSSLVFHKLFLLTKPNNKCRPILDLSHLNSFLKSGTFKMETLETIRLSLQQGEWVTSGLQQYLISYSDKSKVTKVSKVPSEQSNISIHFPTFRPVNSSVGDHQGRKGSQTHGSSEVYPNPPVPRRLVTHSPIPGNLPTTFPDPPGPLPRTGLGSKLEQVRTDSPTNVQLCRITFRPLSRSGQTHSQEMAKSGTEDRAAHGTGDLFHRTVHVPAQSLESHRKNR